MGGRILVCAKNLRSVRSVHAWKKKSTILWFSYAHLFFSKATILTLTQVQNVVTLSL